MGRGGRDEGKAMAHTVRTVGPLQAPKDRGSSYGESKACAFGSSEIGLSRMKGNCAPRDAVLNPWHSQERFGGTPLGHPTDLKAKARGDKSMSEKRGVAEDAYAAALQG